MRATRHPSQWAHIICFKIDLRMMRWRRSGTVVLHMVHTCFLLRIETPSSRGLVPTNFDNADKYTNISVEATVYRLSYPGIYKLVYRFLNWLTSIIRRATTDNFSQTYSYCHLFVQFLFILKLLLFIRFFFFIFLWFSTNCRSRMVL